MSKRGDIYEYEGSYYELLTKGVSAASFFVLDENMERILSPYHRAYPFEDVTDDVKYETYVSIYILKHGTKVEQPDTQKKLF